MPTAEDLRLAIDILRMAKRVEPSGAEHGSHVDHGAPRP